MFGLEGKVVLVTGAAKGIGAAIAREFLQHDCTVIGLDNDEVSLIQLAMNLKTVHFAPICVDLRDLRAVKRACEPFAVDILINNAAVGWGDRNWQALQQINVRAPMFLANLIGKKMKRQNDGSIIFITSIHTADAFPGYAAYAATKGAIVRFMAVKAMELAKFGVRVNAVAPGAIYHAGGTGKLSEKEAISLGQRVPIGRLGEPEDIAPAVAFLASPMASYIVGHELRIDGGLAVNNNLF